MKKSIGTKNRYKTKNICKNHMTYILDRLSQFFEKHYININTDSDNDNELQGKENEDTSYYQGLFKQFKNARSNFNSTSPDKHEKLPAELPAENNFDTEPNANNFNESLGIRLYTNASNKDKEYKELENSNSYQSAHKTTDIDLTPGEHPISNGNPKTNTKLKDNCDPVCNMQVTYEQEQEQEMQDRIKYDYDYNSNNPSFQKKVWENTGDLEQINEEFFDTDNPRSFSNDASPMVYKDKNNKTKTKTKNYQITKNNVEKLNLESSDAMKFLSLNTKNSCIRENGNKKNESFTNTNTKTKTKTNSSNQLQLMSKLTEKTNRIEKNNLQMMEQIQNSPIVTLHTVKSVNHLNKSKPNNKYKNVKSKFLEFYSGDKSGINSLLEKYNKKKNSKSPVKNKRLKENDIISLNEYNNKILAKNQLHSQSAVDNNQNLNNNKESNSNNKLNLNLKSLKSLEENSMNTSYRKISKKDSVTQSVSSQFMESTRRINSNRLKPLDISALGIKKIPKAHSFFLTSRSYMSNLSNTSKQAQDVSERLNSTMTASSRIKTIGTMHKLLDKKENIGAKRNSWTSVDSTLMGMQKYKLY